MNYYKIMKTISPTGAEVFLLINDNGQNTQLGFAIIESCPASVQSKQTNFNLPQYEIEEMELIHSFTGPFLEGSPFEFFDGYLKKILKLPKI